jgi:hypothetical protein
MTFVFLFLILSFSPLSDAPLVFPNLSAPFHLCDEELQFQRFLLKYGKTYTGQAYFDRLNVFKVNLKIAAEILREGGHGRSGGAAGKKREVAGRPKAEPTFPESGGTGAFGQRNRERPPGELARRETGRDSKGSPGEERKALLAHPRRINVARSRC